MWIIIHSHRPRFLRTTGPLQGANGTPLDVRGETQIKIDHIDSPASVVIVDGISHDMIIGHDLLTAGRCVLDYRQRHLDWFGRKWPVRFGGAAMGYAGIGPILPATRNAKFNQLIRENSDVLSAKGEQNGECTLPPVEIKTTGPPISQRAYRVPLTKKKLIDEAIDEMLRDDVIRPSSSPWASPVTLVPKQDGTTRFCVDYRKVNEVTVKDQYPLPQIQEIFDQIGGSTIFSALDLKSGYWQLPVAEKDVQKTAFQCHQGHFEFKKLPFGLCNAPSAFQQTMDTVLSGLLGVCVLVYLDDLVIFSRNEEEHLVHLQLVLDQLRKYNLRLKPTKCSFGLEEINLLGYRVNAAGISTDPDKVKVIAELAPPTTVKEVRSFIGMASYYRQCVPNFSQVAEPLIALTRGKYKRFSWGEPEQAAFDQLKELLI